MGLLDRAAAELEPLDDAERLELLVELSRELPALSEGRRGQPFPESCRVLECQTAVYLWVDVRDGRVDVEADVPLNSPTVRGLVTLLLEAVNGASVDDVLALPDDAAATLSLERALGMQRRQGFRGLIHRLKGAVRRQLDVAPA